VREALDVIVQAFTQEVVEYEGKTIRVPPRKVFPKPIQEPHPPMWMACVAPDSYEMAADRGLGALSFTFNFEAVQAANQSYKAKSRNRQDLCVKAPNDRFVAMVLGYVAESKEEEEIGLRAARWFLHEVAKLFAPLMAKNKLYSYEYLRGIFGIEKDANELTDAELKEHPSVVVGNPDEVIRKLEAFQTAGVDQVAFLKQSGNAPHAALMRSIHRMGESVVPHFQPHKRGALGDRFAVNG
jgi:alkanesulfonate monooxygenase SsuD/methylene tetrahydromethanopterin reductase-like flavin-dependent oxidoreductase (luciferase family)